MILTLIKEVDRCINNARDVLIDDIFTGPMYGIASSMGMVIRSIALTLLSLCFVLEFLKIIVHSQLMKWETGVKVTAKLVLAYVALDISSQLMEAIYATGAELISGVLKVETSMGNLIYDDLQNSLNGLHFGGAIILLATVGLAFLIVWLAGLVIMVMAYARSVELLLHIAIAPIPCAFILLEDHRGSRIFWKFIMSFAANCLQGFFIVLSISLYDALITKIFQVALEKGNSVQAIAGGLFVGAIVLVVCVVKSGTLARQILDA